MTLLPVLLAAAAYTLALPSPPSADLAPESAPIVIEARFSLNATHWRAQTARAADETGLRFPSLYAFNGSGDPLHSEQARLTDTGAHPFPSLFRSLTEITAGPSKPRRLTLSEFRMHLEGTDGSPLSEEILQGADLVLMVLWPPPPSQERAPEGITVTNGDVDRATAMIRGQRSAFAEALLAFAALQDDLRIVYIAATPDFSKAVPRPRG